MCNHLQKWLPPTAAPDFKSGYPPPRNRSTPNGVKSGYPLAMPPESPFTLKRGYPPTLPLPPTENAARGHKKTPPKRGLIRGLPRQLKTGAWLPNPKPCIRSMTYSIKGR
jgi:hypothetical protein